MTPHLDRALLVCFFWPTRRIVVQHGLLITKFIGSWFVKNMYMIAIFSTFKCIIILP